MSRQEWVPWTGPTRGTIRKGPHTMSGRMKRLPWPYCLKCGLIALKNVTSRKALKAECVVEE